MNKIKYLITLLTISTICLWGCGKEEVEVQSTPEVENEVVIIEEPTEEEPEEVIVEWEAKQTLVNLKEVLSTDELQYQLGYSLYCESKNSEESTDIERKLFYDVKKSDGEKETWSIHFQSAPFKKEDLQGSNMYLSMRSLEKQESFSKVVPDIIELQDVSKNFLTYVETDKIDETNENQNGWEQTFRKEEDTYFATVNNEKVNMISLEALTLNDLADAESWSNFDTAYVDIEVALLELEKQVREIYGDDIPLLLKATLSYGNNEEVKEKYSYKLGVQAQDFMVMVSYYPFVKEPMIDKSVRATSKESFDKFATALSEEWRIMLLK